MKARLMWLVLAAALLAACGGNGNSPADRIPDQFELGSVNDAYPGYFYGVSVTISGLEKGKRVPAYLGDATTDQIALYINGESVSPLQGGRVRNGDIVTVRLQAGQEPGGEAVVSLFAGDPPVSAVFKVTTRTTDDPPEIIVDFPPPVSLTEASTVMVRGRVLEGGAPVFVGGQEATVNPDGSWFVEHPLAEGAQEVAVRVVEGTGIIEVPLSVTRLPVIGTEPFGTGYSLFGLGGLVIIPGSTRLLYGVFGSIAELDLSTGERRKWVENFEGVFDGFLNDIVLDAARLKVYASSYSGQHEGMALFDLEAGTVEAVSYKGDGKGDDALFGYVASVAFDPVNEVSYLLVRDAADPMAGIWRIWRVDRDGNREPVAEAPYSLHARLRHDARNNRLLLAANDLYAIDPATGEGEVLAAREEGSWFLRLAADPESGEIAAYLRKPGDVYEIQLLHPGGPGGALPGTGDPAFGPALGYSYGYDVDWQHRVAYVASAGPNHGHRVTAVDLETGHRVIVAKE